MGDGNMNKKISNSVDSMLITVGMLIGINDIESLLGIIVLCIQLLWIFVKIVLKIRNHIINKTYDQIDDVIHDGLNELKDLQDKKDGE